jgi:hypothetical protein
MNQITINEIKERVEKVKVELEYATRKFENPAQVNEWTESLRQVLVRIHDEETIPQ